MKRDDPELAEKVKRLLLEEIPESQSHGGDRRSNEVQVRVTNLKAQTDTAEYIVARLKRDAPELAEKVIRGELTPNAAARQMGWRKPRMAICHRLAMSKMATCHRLAIRSMAGPGRACRCPQVA